MPNIHVSSSPGVPTAPATAAAPGGEVYLSRDDAAAYLGISKSYMAGLAVRGGGPAMCRLAPRLVRYRRSDLDAWAATRLRRSTSEATALKQGEAA